MEVEALTFLTEPERSALRRAAQLLRDVPDDDPDKPGAEIVTKILDGVSADAEARRAARRSG